MAKLRISRFQDRNESEAYYLKQIDLAAEEARDILPGQTMVYEAKFQEASRYPNSPPFPWLEAEAEELGLSVGQVVVTVLVAREQWEQEGTKLETKRLKAKRAVREANSTAHMHREVEKFKALI